MPVFIPGQRWVSETETNLGLGIVVEANDRQLVLSFPAAGERRTYAIDNAPVGRVQYSVGDEIVSMDDLRIKVDEVATIDGCLVYRGADSEGKSYELHELELNAFVQISTPKARLFAGQIDHNKRFELRCETIEQIRRHQQSSVSGLLGARVQLLPHQLYIAHETAKRFAPRVLLADEVGLGKTIEAGLITHQQLFSGRASRVMILVPENLVHQWLVEMLRRFNLHFTILDHERFEAVALDDSNPFEAAQLVLCPISLLVENPSAQQQALASAWDLLLVDEAHHLEWSEQQTSPAYRCVEALAKVAQGLLLLTATPEQLGLDSHFARLRLLDPDRYYDLDKFREEEANYQQINSLVQELLCWVDAQELANTALLPEPEELGKLLEQLQQYLDQTSIEPLRNWLAGYPSESPLQQIVEPLIGALLDRHGIGRVLFRNTRDNVKGFPERQLITHPLQAPQALELATSEADNIELRLYPELVLGDNWPAQDPRVQWLSQWLRKNRESKALVICARAETAVVLEEYLRHKSGVQSAVFHEGMELVARDRAAAYFADIEEGAQILICSEIGSEGRNFQFAHHLVLFDLPLNPDLLEQRIGRLDRIGQRETVKIHVPYIELSAQATLLRWHHEGINGFAQTSAVGQAVFQHFAGQLQQCMLTGENIDQLIIETRTVREQLQQTLQQGRDKLLELSSCKPQEAQQIVRLIEEQEKGQELFCYMSRVFEQFGVDQDTHGPNSLVLHPGDHMYSSHFPGLPEGGVTVTHSRRLALVREDIQFLTWEHPMVVGAMDMVLNEGFGNTSVCTLKLPPLKPGSLLLEAVFVLHCPAPAQLQLARYLPLTSVRILLDVNHKDFTEVLTHERLNQRVQRVKKAVARELVRHAQTQIADMLEQAETRVRPQQETLVKQAISDMQQAQALELQRLQALAKVNPNIRLQEIELLKQETDSLEYYLQNAKLNLDALRVIVIV